MKQAGEAYCLAGSFFVRCFAVVQMLHGFVALDLAARQAIEIYLPSAVLVASAQIATGLRLARTLP